jgi:UPF0716 protein FxsA
MVVALLVLLFIVGPIAELYVIIQVADVIGGWQTVALLLVESILGAWLMKRGGRGAIRKIQARLEARQLPSKEVVDGALIVFAGALMLTPGFLTDILGFLLLIPPTRAVVRAALLRRLRGRLGTGFRWVGAGPRTTSGGAADVFDTTGRDIDEGPALPRPERRP